MTAVEVWERCDELTDGMDGSVDAVTRALIDPSWDPGLGLLKAWMTMLAFSLGLLVVFSPGCSSAQNQPAAPPTVNVSGVGGRGTWTYGNQGGTVTLHLQQTGSRVIGSAAVGGGYPVANGAIEGTVIANQLSYRRTGVDLKVELPYGADLTVNGDEMSGYSTGGSRLKLQRQEWGRVVRHSRERTSGYIGVRAAGLTTPQSPQNKTPSTVREDHHDDL